MKNETRENLLLCMSMMEAACIDMLDTIESERAAIRAEIKAEQEGRVV